MHSEDRRIRYALNVGLRDVLAPVAAAFAVLYGVLAFVYRIELTSPAARLTTFAMSLASALVYALTAIRFRLRPVPASAAQRGSAWLVSIAYANCAVGMVVTREAAHESDFAILILGASLLFYSVPYLATVVGVTLATWFAIVWGVDRSLGSVHYGIALAVASGIGIYGQRLRVRAFSRIVASRVEVERQRESLEAANARLTASEERFRRFASISVEGIVFHENGRILEANERFAEIFGCSADALGGRRVADVVAPSDSERFDAALTQDGDRPNRFVGSRSNGTQVALDVVGRQVTYGGAVAHMLSVRDVTEEVRLANDRDRFFDLSLDLLCIADTRGYFVQLNPAWKEVTGYDLDELMARPFVEFVHPDDRQRTIEETSRLATGERTIQFENRYLCADGSCRVFAWMARPYVSEGLIYAVARDITTRQRELDEMRHVLSGIRGLLWHATVTNYSGAFEWDIHVSDAEAAQRFLPLDVAPGESYEQAWHDSKSPEHRVHMDEVAIGALLRNQAHYSQEYPCKRADGLVQWLYEDVRVESLGSNRWQLIGVCTDVTELKRVERALRESEERFRTVFENAPMGMAIVSTDGRLTRVNREMTRILGYVPRELLASFYLSYTHPDDRDDENALFSRIVSGEMDSFRTENRAIAKDGRVVWGNVAAFPVFNSMGELQFLVRVFEDITERKSAEELERNTSRRIEAILRSAADGIVTVNADWVIEAFNPAAERMFACAATEAIGKSLSDIAINGEARTKEQLDELARRSADSGTAQIEVVGIRADRSTFIADLSISELRLGDERSFTVMIRDVTERRNAEIALSASEERFRAVFESAAIAINVVSPEGMILRANDAMKDFVRFPHDSIERMHFRDISHPDDTQRDELLFHELITGHRSRYALEKRYFDRNGATKWGFVTASVVRDRTGKVLYVVRMIEDITERKRTLDALRESEERYRDLFENATDLIQSVRPDGTFAYVNRSWLQTLGYARDDVPNLRIMDVIHPECRPKCQEIFRRVMLGDPIDAIQTDFVTSRGERIAVEGSVSCRFENGEPAATRAILHDITERQQLDRLKDEFVSTVSHELRTPLTSIFGSLGLLTGGAAGPLSETMSRMLRIAYSNSERLIRLVNDLLDMQKLESGRIEFHLEPLPVSPLVAEAAEANKAFAEQYGVTFEIEDRSNGAIALVDRDRLLQVLANLLSNASKFTNRGTAVQVSVSTDDSSVRVDVTDHGPGIPVEFRNRIFAKFAQADSSDSRQKGGTGLGLSITKAIVERLGGSIRYESVIDAGTTFSFTLPRYDRSSTSRPASRPGSVSRRLLICEDDPDVAATMSALLAETGYETSVAPTASRASEMLADGGFDALVLDLVLPDGSGINLLRSLRAQEATRSLPVVVVSVIAHDERTRLEGAAFEVVDWIAKPFSAERLLNAVRVATRNAPNRRPAILHVEDDVDVLHVVAEMIDVADVTFATTLAEARQKLADVPYDLLILDVVLPDGSGLDLVPIAEPANALTPVVVFSAHDVSSELAGKVSAVMVKSKASNAQLIALIDSLLVKRLTPSGIIAGLSSETNADRIA